MVCSLWASAKHLSPSTGKLAPCCLGGGQPQRRHGGCWQPPLHTHGGFSRLTQDPAHPQVTDEHGAVTALISVRQLEAADSIFGRSLVSRCHRVSIPEQGWVLGTSPREGGQQSPPPLTAEGTRMAQNTWRRHCPPSQAACHQVCGPVLVIQVLAAVCSGVCDGAGGPRGQAVGQLLLPLHLHQSVQLHGCLSILHR